MGEEMGGFAVVNDNDSSSSSSGGSGCSHRGVLSAQTTPLPPPSPPPSPSSSMMADLPLGRPKSPPEGDDLWGFVLCSLGIVTTLVTLALGGRDTVLTLQIAFDGAIDQIQQDLDLISITADSRTKAGLHSLLSETASCIYRYSKSCFSAKSKANVKLWRSGGWHDCFHLTYYEERKKLNAFINGNDCRHRRTRCEGAIICPNNKYLIVTILVAAAGSHELPAINSYSDLDAALYILTYIPHHDIRAVKVFTTLHDDIEELSSLRHLRSGC